MPPPTRKAADKAETTDGATERRLNTYVTIHPEGEPSVTYGPGDIVPPKHAALITNPQVWTKAPEPGSPAPSEQNASPPVNYREVEDLDVLRAMATDRGVAGADTMDRDPLIQALEATSPPSTDTTVES